MDRASEGRKALLEMLGEIGARPVDDVVRALTYREIGVSPSFDLATVAARPEEFKAPLLAELALTPAEVGQRVEASPGDRYEYWLHTFALYLMALWNEPRAYQAIVAYLAADPDLADMQLGDILTEDMPAILARTYDGSDLAPIKALIEDPSAPPFLRDAAMRGLHAMARMNKLRLSEVVDYFEALSTSMAGAANETFIDVFAMSMCQMREPRLRPQLERWIDAGLIDKRVLRRDDIDHIYAKPYDELNEELTRSERFDAVLDYLSEWPWFLASDPSEFERGPGTDDGAGSHGDPLAAMPMMPFIRDGRKIGRNEPCPCGSGKKYKKCCLVAEDR